MNIDVVENALKTEIEGDAWFSAQKFNVYQIVKEGKKITYPAVGIIRKRMVAESSALEGGAGGNYEQEIKISFRVIIALQFLGGADALVDKANQAELNLYNLIVGNNLSLDISRFRYLDGNRDLTTKALLTTWLDFETKIWRHVLAT